MALHSTLTDPYLHEPKGASTADAGMVYVADGAGSGTWTLPFTGFGYYTDDAAEQTFTTTASKVSIDGVGTTTNTARLPLAIRGTGDLWDTTNNKITPISEGDAYSCRLILPVTAKAGSPNYTTVILDIGGAGTVTIPIAELRVDATRTPPFSAFADFTMFSESTFLANGGQLFVSTDTGSIGITAPSLLVARIHAEV